MDMLLISDEGEVDPWCQVDRMVAKRKQWTQDGSLAKMKKLNGGSVNPWDQVEELTVDLDGPCSLSGLNVDLTSSSFTNSDALLSLPSLSAFKQELLSPFSNSDGSGELTGSHNSSPPSNTKQIPCNGKEADYPERGDSPAEGGPKGRSGVETGTGLLVTTAPATSTVHRGAEESGGPFSPEAPPINTEFQYVLAAPTSIATKVGDETLTYLNQGQPYEIKLKKLGDLSEYRGKILKSVIRLSFHERRLQYMEREQMSAWVATHPGDSILEIDLPLSYGIFDIHQDQSQLNTVEFLWDPTKEGGVYVKVNCISTEFTPKKHGGEKGVPFRIQVDTYLQGEMESHRKLHAASCQVKVFKLKGADRKHKQDREKILKRPRIEQEKYQCSYEVTILTDTPVSNEFDCSSILATTVPQIITPEGKGRAIVTSSSLPKEEASPHQAEVISPPDSPLQKVDVSGGDVVPLADWGPGQTALWLQANRYATHASHALSSYSGADLLRLSREDLVQLCGLSDGIRLFNALHARTVPPRLTLYLMVEPRERAYRVVYLERWSSVELKSKVCCVLGLVPSQLSALYILGPSDIRLLPTDDLVAHLPDHSAFTITLTSDSQEKYLLIMKPSESTSMTA